MELPLARRITAQGIALGVIPTEANLFQPVKVALYCQPFLFAVRADQGK